MKWHVLFAAPAIAAIAATAGLAQNARTAMAPAEVTLTNSTRFLVVTGYVITDDAGKVVGQLDRKLGPGQSAGVKLAKGAPCTLYTTTKFAGEGASASTPVPYNACIRTKVRIRD